MIWPVYELFLVADWVKALHSESEGSRFQSHKVLGRAFGPDLVTRLPVVLGQK